MTSDFDKGYDAGYRDARNENLSPAERRRRFAVLTASEREGYEAALEAHWEMVNDI